MTRKLLLIEDSPEAFFLITMLLERIGYSKDDILGYTNLRDALQHEPEELEIVITDLSLPDSDYNETFSRVCARYPAVPIVVMTSHEEEEHAISTIKQGAQDYLIKTDIDHRLLKKTIQYAIERKRLFNDYKRIFQENPVPMYVFDRKTFRMLNVNEAAMRQYGYSKEEFLSLNAEDIRPLQDIPKFRKMGRTDDVYFDAGRWRHKRKDGSEFYVRIYVHRSEFEGHDASVVMAIDVDMKVRMEMQLREKTEETESILGSITDGFYTVDKHWRFTHVNKKFEQILNRSREDLVGKNMWDEFPASRNLRFFREYRRAMREHVSVHFEEYDPMHDLLVSVNAYPTRTGLAVFFHDITEQKQLQRQAFLERQNLLAIINNTKDIIWSIDTNMQIISANNAFWQRVQRITGKSARNLTAEDFPKDLFMKWQGFFKEILAGRIQKMVWEELSADGTPTFEENSFNLIHNERKEVIGISCFSRDITEQKLYLDKIEQQNEQLLKIAHIQSHEVRSPVAAILGLIDLFHKEDMGNPANREILDKLHEATGQLDSVIRKINDNTGIV